MHGMTDDWWFCWGDAEKWICQTYILQSSCIYGGIIRCVCVCAPANANIARAHEWIASAGARTHMTIVNANRAAG